MQRAISRTLLSSFLSLAFTACGTLLPDSGVTVDPSVSRSDVEAIERLLPVVGVRHPISGVTRDGDTYSVTCRGRDLSEWTYEYFTFTVYHRHGRWIPDKSSVRKDVGTIVS
jgi:hypothetical protein